MKSLRVLMAHNYYQQAGGEDIVFAAEKDLLRSRGHEVIEYVDTNMRLKGMNRVVAAKESIWSVGSYQAIKKLISETKPDIAHFHNTFLMISPSVYYACRELGVPVVQSLHNYRLACPSAIFYRDKHNCEDCLGKAFAWPGVFHGCYRGSIAQSLVVASMLFYHKVRKTWDRQVNAYITSTDFSRTKLIQAGFSAEHIFVKPNFSHDVFEHANFSGNYVLAIGRLSSEKGVDTVLQAWKTLKGVPLKITGDGNLRSVVEESAIFHSDINYLGFVGREEIAKLVKGARFLVFASRMYEVFPMAISEAYASGVPVIASRLGVMTELVHDDKTGILFNPGDASDLADKINWLWNRPEETARMGRNARQEYEQKYSPDQNYKQLIAIYEKVLGGYSR